MKLIYLLVSVKLFSASLCRFLLTVCGVISDTCVRHLTKSDGTKIIINMY